MSFLFCPLFFHYFCLLKNKIDSYHANTKHKHTEHASNNQTDTASPPLKPGYLCADYVTEK